MGKYEEPLARVQYGEAFRAELAKQSRTGCEYELVSPAGIEYIAEEFVGTRTGVAKAVAVLAADARIRNAQLLPHDVFAALDEAGYLINPPSYAVPALKTLRGSAKIIAKSGSDV